MTSKQNPSIELVALLTDPEKVAEVPEEEIPRIVGQLESLKVALLVRLTVRMVQERSSSASNQGNWLTVNQACEKYHLSSRWFYDRVGKVTFIKKASRKKLLIYEPGLLRWLTRQA